MRMPLKTADFASVLYQTQEVITSYPFMTNMNMKIIQTPPRFPPYTGGVEQYAHMLSKRLVERGHEVVVICANESGNSKTRDVIDGIDIIRVNDIGKIAQTNITPSLPIELIRELRDADLIHTHLPTPWSSDISILIAKLMGVPSVVTYHNDIRGDGIATHIAKLYNLTSLKLSLSLVDCIITTQESYFAGSNIPAKVSGKVHTIRNGVDVDKFKPTDSTLDNKKLRIQKGKTNLFFLSVLDKYHSYKGLDRLIESMGALDSDYHLLVGGDGSEREKYENMANDQGVSDQITFLGYISDNQLPQYYTHSDCFVLPSTSSEQEGFGLVLLEALACGTPVVTTDIVGVADEIKQKKELGLVIDEPSVDSLIKAIRSVNERNNPNPDECRAFCVDNYSWDGVVDDLIGVYSGLVTSK